MYKWSFAALAALLFAAVAYAQTFEAFPVWTTSTRFGTSPGTVGYNTQTNALEYLDKNNVWQQVADAPIAGAVMLTPTYNAATNPLPVCTTSLIGVVAVVTDATSPTYHGTYTSGSTVVSPVFCNGANWLTD